VSAVAPPTGTARMIAQLVEARKAAGLTQDEVARRIGSTQAHLSLIERGIRSPRLTLVESYARAVGARIVWRVDLATNEPTPDLAAPCPYCGHHTLYRPDSYTGRVSCANPICDSNHPPRPREESTRG
jgi:transcriptional regulator with XRE-family HTH domain